MHTPETKLYRLPLTELRTYFVALLFVAGNIVLPQICHLFSLGGLRWLPIYFFTLIAAYKYGWRVGLLTAVLSPIVNSLIFSMPPLHALPAILIKSILLAAAAGYAAWRFRKASILLLVGVVLFYQIMGTLCECPIVGNLHDAMQDFRIGLPGMLVQVFGGFLLINYVIRK